MPKGTRFKGIEDIDTDDSFTGPTYQWLSLRHSE